MNREGLRKILRGKCVTDEACEAAIDELLNLHSVGKSLPIGDVEILLKGLEHIGKWGDEEEERWDDPGDCAMDTLSQYRYSMSIR